MPPLTIIIPVYNRQSDAEKAIVSVIEQGVDVEIIVVDDYSSPAFQLPKGQSAENIRIIRHNKNMGSSQARNTGLEAANGAFVSFLDSDDFLLPNTLEARFDEVMKQLAATNQNVMPVFGCGWQDRTQSGNITSIRTPKPAASAKDFLGGCWIAPGSTIIAPRSLFCEKIGKFDTTLRRLEDVDWFIRFAMAGGNFIPLPIIGASILRHTKKNGAEIIEAGRCLVGKYKSELNKHELDRLRSYILLEEANVKKREGNIVGMGAKLAASWFLHPRTRVHLTPGWIFQTRNLDEPE